MGAPHGQQVGIAGSQLKGGGGGFSPWPPILTDQSTGHVGRHEHGSMLLGRAGCLHLLSLGKLLGMVMNHIWLCGATFTPRIVCTHIQMHTHMHTHTCTHTHVHTHVHTHYMYTHICTHTYKCMYTHAHTHIHTCTHTHMHAHSMHTHTHTHTYTQGNLSWFYLVTSTLQ